MDIDVRQLYEDLGDENDEVKKKAYQAYKELKQVPVEVWIADLKDENSEKREQAAYAIGLTYKKEAIEPLIDAINDPDVSVREAAAWSLGLLEDERAIEPLMQALNDECWEVRYDAIWSLGDFREFFIDQMDRFVSFHIKVLTDPVSEVRNSTISSLGRLRADEAYTAILPALEDEDYEVRANAARVLAEDWYYLPQAASDKMFQLLNTSSNDIRLRIIDALGGIMPKNKNIIDVLISALHDPNPDIRAASAETLNNTNGIHANQALVEAIDDEEPRVRACAIETLGYLGSEGVYEKLIGYLDDPLDVIRAGAANGLSGLGDERAINRLKQVFENDHSEKVRRAALFAVTNLDEDNKLDYLLKGLKDDSSIVRQFASDKIDFSTDTKIIEPLVELIDDYDAKVRANAIWALGLMIMNANNYEENLSEAALAIKKLLDEKAIESIINALDDTDNLVRLWSLDALVNIGSERAIDQILKMAKEGNKDAENALCSLKHPSMIEPMMELLRNGNAKDRKRAIRVLSEYPDPQFTDLLLDAFDDPDPEVRSVAIDQIIYKEDPRIIDALLPLLDDKDARVRSSAVYALGYLKAERAVNAIIKALDDKGIEVRENAANALVNIATPEAEKALLDRFDSERPEIVKAARNFFISKGIPGSEQILLEVLEQHGWLMAEAFAFSGNPLLEKAGRDYFHENYFPDEPEEHEISPKWGSDR